MQKLFFFICLSSTWFIVSYLFLIHYYIYTSALPPTIEKLSQNILDTSTTMLRW